MSVLQLSLLVTQLSHAANLELPSYQTTGAAGLDLRAAISDHRPITLFPGKRVLVPTGLVFEVPQNFEIQIRPRSSLALQHGITCLNTPGTVDSDYRGEIQVLLINHGEEEFRIIRGMRIAQAIVACVAQVKVIKSTHMSETARSTGGFGSTGQY
ncbi:MAG: dUTP pyrophosphatase [Candidatus Tokpelaia sp. JSC188]|nr:MAG: dUTP pyrophosphatase [Candidatus Tokpelaia sp. JSC188]